MVRGLNIQIRLSVWAVTAFTLISLLVSNNLYGQKGRQAKLQALYDSLIAYDVDCPKTVLAVAILETGWMECKNCTYRYNNLFGFRGNKGYIHFSTLSQCLAYLKKWQVSFYEPWAEKNPNHTYYQFLAHIKYAKNMAGYISMIKHLEKWIDEHIELKT